MFVVRVYIDKQTTEKVTIGWNSNWTEFLMKMADQLELAPKDLALSYRLTTWKKDRANTRIKNVEGWDELKEEILTEREHLANAAKKPKGKKAVQELEILVYNAPKKVVDTGAGKKGKNVGDRSGKRKRTEEEGQSAGSTEDQKVDWLNKLKEKFKCSVTGHTWCYVEPSGQHKELLHADLGFWSNLLVSCCLPLYTLNTHLVGRTVVLNHQKWKCLPREYWESLTHFLPPVDALATRVPQPVLVLRYL